MNKQFMFFLALGLVFWPVTLAVMVKDAMEKDEQRRIAAILQRAQRDLCSVHINPPTIN